MLFVVGWCVFFVVCWVVLFVECCFVLFDCGALVLCFVVSCELLLVVRRLWLVVRS